ncbi:hypothetical protein [Vibrio penaeicida]|uniref:Tail assembly protein n=1 Tax=Vibrio penaeicida TaxID=104609 RepID=A0AAV5NRF0_9VIBR|nr:hypothetical protein [Vibrio penaeicida]RTZ21751.1 hypothetical protein EKN09_17730 [Vibrio penaeicida]GLQ72914.1 tail assembly protein [Vibrio penaeicida]
MAFQFSPQDRMITVYHLCELGTLLGGSDMLIEAHTGLPAMSTHIKPPPQQAGKTCRFTGTQWEYVIDYRGKRAYCKDRNGEDYDITALGPLPDTHTLLVPAPMDQWDDTAGTWVVNVALKKQALTETEITWQRQQVAKVEEAINHYQQDRAIPEHYSNLRVTTFTDDQYYQLLQDRKRLVDYVKHPDFPECGRPTLSGWV